MLGLRNTDIGMLEVWVAVVENEGEAFKIICIYTSCAYKITNLLVQVFTRKFD